MTLNTQKQKHSMKRAHFSLLFFIIFLLFSPIGAHSQTGAWKAYMAYSEVQQIVKGGNLLYVRASNDLYTYNLNDHTIVTYDKVNALNDSYITHIAWNQQAKRLLIVYKNSNMDIMDQQGNVISLSALYTKTMTQDKTVNRVDITDHYAYLSTGFGIVKLNMQRCEVAESYILNQNIHATGHDNLYLYALRSDGQVLRGLLEQNLIDPHNWELTDAAPVGVFNQDNSDYAQYLATIQTLQPGGPKYNNFAYMKFKNNRLYTAGGGFVTDDIVELMRPATIQVYDENNDWTILDDENIKERFAPNESAAWSYIDMMCVDVDPTDPSHLFGGSRTGLYEFRDGKMVKYYNKDNSPIVSALGNSHPDANAYLLVEGVLFDKQGNLWVLQSQAQGSPILKLSKDGQWSQYDHDELMSGTMTLGALQAMMEDSEGKLWFVNKHYGVRSFYCYDPQSDKVLQSFTRLYNQDGTSYSDYFARNLTEDLDGNIWVSTSVGPFMVQAAERYTTSTVYQEKIPRNDGTNYADYLMANSNVSDIVIDGGNRKWIGTRGAGVFLISADNMTQIYNFTTQNSPLLSDNIEALAWNEVNGELFIATDAGLCSYFTDATKASLEMTKDNVYAFPNPVVSGYNGLITVRGLTRDADVKILTTSGQLVAQGRSNGGTFTWNACDSQGRRVASGVYMVCTATSTGESGVVCKIAIIK